MERKFKPDGVGLAADVYDTGGDFEAEIEEHGDYLILTAGVSPDKGKAVLNIRQAQNLAKWILDEMGKGSNGERKGP